MGFSTMTNTKWKFYSKKEDKKIKYKWSRKADNGNIIGASTQGYTKKEDCIANAKVNGFESDKIIVWKDDKEDDKENDYIRY